MKEDIKGAEETAETEASEIPIADGIDEMESGGKEDKEAASDEEQPAENEAAGDSREDSSKEEKKGFFKKKKDPRDEKIEELTDRVKRQMAEFENLSLIHI